MRCFYHQDVEAVAGCKNCARGLCPACAVDVGNGIACRDRCEAEVRALNLIVERNKTAYQKARSAYARTAAFYAALGLAFLGAGLVDWRGMAWVLTPAGAIFLVAAYVHFTTGRRYEGD
jgi:hypothetical protein